MYLVRSGGLISRDNNCFCYYNFRILVSLVLYSCIGLYIGDSCDMAVECCWVFKAGFHGCIGRCTDLESVW